MSTGNPFKKVFSGATLDIPAKAWNALMDIAQDANADRLMDGPTTFGKGGGIVNVLNNSTVNLDRFSVLATTGVAITHANNANEFLREPTLLGDLPDDSTLDKFVILFNPINAGAIGKAFAFGVCPVLVNMTDTTHGFATAVVGETANLESGTSGAAQILTVEAGTGSQWAVVRFGGNSSSSAMGSLTPLTTIGDNIEGSETADSTTWTRGDHAVEVWTTSRVVYNDAGDQILYLFVRKFTYDTLGDLRSISGETRIGVDTPEDC